MYHIVSQDRALRVFDSQKLRFTFDAINDTLPPSHYRLPMLERFSPWTHQFGPGRIFVDGLSPYDVRTIIGSEKAELRFERRLKFDRLPALPIAADVNELSIHGATAISRHQPLTPSARGIRMHNDDLLTLMTYLEPRLDIGQLVVLTILPPATQGK